MPLASILKIASGALSAQDLGIGVTGHNIANASTPGYSRQQLQLTEATPLQTPDGMLGRGVQALGVRQTRDQYLDVSYWQESGSLGQSMLLQNTLQQAQAVFNEPGDNGFGATLDAYWTSWADLANDPTNAGARAVVVRRGAQLATSFNQISRRLSQIVSNATDGLRSDVGTVNSIAGQIASLNGQISIAEANGGQASDLRDERTKLVDQLSQLVPTRIVPHDNGTIGVLAGDLLLVDGGAAQTLSLQTAAGGGYEVVAGDAGHAYTISAGRLQAGLELVNATLPGLQRQLDSQAAAIVNQVNTLHGQGVTANGGAGVPFFIASGLTAGTMAVSASVLADPNNVAAGAIGPGDGAIARQLAALGDTALSELGGQSLSQSYRAMVTSLGAAVSNAQQLATSQQTIVTQLDNQRSSVAGVSLDEEMVNLITYQQGYAAAARVVTVANQMMQDLLQMV
jgi:flagellar hook-associated protein 1 FlgK